MWSGIEIKSGLKEGRGVFANALIKKNLPLCNYGGVQLSRTYAEKYLLPDEDKCNYLVELLEKIALCGLRWFKLNVSKYQKMSSCQKDVKLSKRCQMSKNETPRLWRRFTKKLN